MARPYEAYEREVFDTAQKLCTGYLQTGACAVFSCKSSKFSGFIYGSLYFVMAGIILLSFHFGIAEGYFHFVSLIIPFFPMLMGVLIIFKHRAKIKELRIEQDLLIFKKKNTNYKTFNINEIEALRRIHRDGNSGRYGTIASNFIQVDRKKYRLIFQTSDIDAIILIAENKRNNKLEEFGKIGCFEEWIVMKNEDGSVLPDSIGVAKFVK